MEYSVSLNRFFIDKTFERGSYVEAYFVGVRESRFIDPFIPTSNEKIPMKSLEQA